MLQKKSEIPITIKKLPQAKILDNGWRKFKVNSHERVISVGVDSENWKILTNAQAKYPQWVATITCKRNKVTEKDFLLLGFNVQVREETPYIEEITKFTEGLRLPAFAYKPPDYTDEECIEMIRFLPDHVMQHEHGIWLGSGDSKANQFAQIIRKQYYYTAEWLEYYVLNNTKNLTELRNPGIEKHYYKPLAEKSLAILKLIKEVGAFCQWLDADKLCNNRWWLACEWELCDKLLFSSGYFGKPTMIGGRAMYNNAIQSEKELDSGSVETVIRENTEVTPMEASEGFSHLISQSNYEENRIFNFTHYAEYKRVVKSCLRRLSKCSELDVVYLSDEQIVYMQRGNPQRKRIIK